MNKPSKFVSVRMVQWMSEWEVRPQMDPRNCWNVMRRAHKNSGSLGVATEVGANGASEHGKGAPESEALAAGGRRRPLEGARWEFVKMRISGPGGFGAPRPARSTHRPAQPRSRPDQRQQRPRS